MGKKLLKCTSEFTSVKICMIYKARTFYRFSMSKQWMSFTNNGVIGVINPEIDNKYLLQNIEYGCASLTYKQSENSREKVS